MCKGFVYISYFGVDFEKLAPLTFPDCLKLVSYHDHIPIVPFFIRFLNLSNLSESFVFHSLNQYNTPSPNTYTIIQVTESEIEDYEKLASFNIQEIWPCGIPQHQKIKKLEFTARKLLLNKTQIIPPVHIEALPDLLGGYQYLPGGVLLAQHAYISYISEVWKDILGDTFLLSIGDNIAQLADYMMPDDAMIFRKLYKMRTELQFAKSVYKCKFPKVNSKHAIWLELNIYQTFDPEKKLLLSTVYANNITEIQKLETELADSENRYTALSDLSFEGIILHNKGICIDANNSLLKMTGYSRSDLKNVNVIDLFIYDNKDRKQIFENLQKNYAPPYLVKMRRLDGSEFSAELESKMIVYQGADVRVTSVRDITFRLEAQKMLATSKAEFQSLFHHTPIGLFRCNSAGLLQMANPVMRAMLNIDSRNPVDNLYLFDTTSDSGKFRNKYIEQFSPETPMQQYILNTTDANGTPKYYHETLNAIYNNHSQVDYIEGTSIDITERKIAEKEEEYRAILFHLLSISASELISLPNEERIIAYASEMLYFMSMESCVITVVFDSDNMHAHLKSVIGLAPYLSQSTEENFKERWLNQALFLPNFMHEFIVPGELIHVNTDTDELLNTIITPDFEPVLNLQFNLQTIHRIILRSKVNLKYTFYIVPRILLDINNHSFVETFVFQLENALERIRLDMQLMESRTRAEKANEAKSVFLTTISHELRTPLNLITGNNEILARNLVNSPLISNVVAIQSAGDKLLEIINDIIELSHMGSNSHESLPEPVNLYNTAYEILNSFKNQAIEKNIELLAEIDILKTYNFRINVNRFRQVLNHLLSNAVKFTNRGNVKIFAVFTPDNYELGQLDIKVQDTGIGIEEKNMSRIFEPFVQIDDKDDRKYGGSGLGLSIARRMCELMNAHIFAHSLPGVGTTFTISFDTIKGYIVDTSATDNSQINQRQNENSLWAKFLAGENCLDDKELDIIKINKETLYYIFTEQIDHTWKEALDSNSLTVMEQLADELIHTGELFQLNILSNFGTYLKSYVQSFNYPKLIRMLDSFKKMKEELFKIRDE